MYSPKFTITNKILKNIGSIEASKEVIDNAPLLPYFEKEFREDAMVRTVHYGTHIEGNELNFSEAEKVLCRAADCRTGQGYSGSYQLPKSHGLY